MLEKKASGGKARMVLIVECEKGKILSGSAEKLALSGRVDARHEAEQVLSHLTLHSVSTGTVTEGVLRVASLARVEGVAAGQSHADFVQWETLFTEVCEELAPWFVDADVPAGFFILNIEDCLHDIWTVTGLVLYKARVAWKVRESLTNESPDTQIEGQDVHVSGLSKVLIDSVLV